MMLFSNSFEIIDHSIFIKELIDPNVAQGMVPVTDPYQLAASFF